MSDQENFLARWSRRKREAEHEHTQDGPQKAASIAETDAEATPTLEEECAEVVRAGAERKADAAQAPAVDLTKLPTIESITAATDIRPFLGAGVPEELKYAALRRAWVVDPAIRDFVGIAENQWDFTAPGGAPGFGPLLPVDDVRRLVAEIVGDQPEVPPIEASDVTVSRPQLAAVTRESAADVNEQQLRDPGATPESVTSHTHTSGSEAERNVIVRASNADAASQDDAHDPRPKQSGRRPHGSALPE